MAVHVTPDAAAAIALTAAAGKEFVKTVLGDLYSYAKGKVSYPLKRWNAQKNIGRAYSKIASIRKVKTLWQIDKAVDLMSFYCPSHIKIGPNRRRIDRLADIGVKDNLLIEGIAGQGKSILLRYLTAVELAGSKILPVFLELRRIEVGETVSSHILDFLSSIGVESDDQLLHALLESGQVVLFLDAFDELDEQVRLSVLKEIEALASHFESLRIIVSSRPGSDLRMSPHFRVVTLSDLQGREYELVVHKLLEDDPTADQLIKRVESHGGGIRSLLATPLLVTLLVIIYKSYQEIPSQLSEFYENLFQLLLQRHDGAKPGYKRRRRCKINDAQYRLVFEGFCFYSKNLKPGVMRSPQVYEAAVRAAADAQLNVDPEEFIRDIVTITCLLLEEGGEYRFIHKSVQEFYAACFLRRKPELLVRDFYPKLLGRLYSSWENEVRFLSEIDSYRLQKFAFLPSALSLLGINETDLNAEVPSQAVEHARGALGNFSFTFGNDGQLMSILSSASLSPYVQSAFECMKLKPPWPTVSTESLKGFLTKASDQASNGSASFYEAKWAALADRGILRDWLEDAAKQFAAHIFKAAREMRDHIRRQEQQDALSLVLP